MGEGETGLVERWLCPTCTQNEDDAIEVPRGRPLLQQIFHPAGREIEACQV